MAERSRFQDLLNSSPFTEIPTLATLTRAQLEHIKAVGEEILKQREKLFNLPEGEVATVSLESLSQALENSKQAPVWQLRHRYARNSKLGRGVPAHVLDTNGDVIQTMSVDVVEAGKFICCDFTDEENSMISVGDKEFWQLFEAGVPVLLSNLLTFDKHNSGQEIANTTLRTRLGEGVVPAERDQYIALKLKQADANGNKILMQKIG